MILPLRSVLLSVRCIFPSLMHLDVVCIRIILFLVLCYYNDLITFYSIARYRVLVIKVCDESLRNKILILSLIISPLIGLRNRHVTNSSQIKIRRLFEPSCDFSEQCNYFYAIQTTIS